MPKSKSSKSSKKNYGSGTHARNTFNALFNSNLVELDGIKDKKHKHTLLNNFWEQYKERFRHDWKTLQPDVKKRLEKFKDKEKWILDGSTNSDLAELYVSVYPDMMSHFNIFFADENITMSLSNNGDAIVAQKWTDQSIRNLDAKSAKKMFENNNFKNELFHESLKKWRVYESKAKLRLKKQASIYHDKAGNIINKVITHGAVNLVGSKIPYLKDGFGKTATTIVATEIANVMLQLTKMAYDMALKYIDKVSFNPQAFIGMVKGSDKILQNAVESITKGKSPVMHTNDALQVAVQEPGVFQKLVKLWGQVNEPQQEKELQRLLNPPAATPTPTQDFKQINDDLAEQRVRHEAEQSKYQAPNTLPPTISQLQTGLFEAVGGAVSDAVSATQKLLNLGPTQVPTQERELQKLIQPPTPNVQSSDHTQRNDALAEHRLRAEASAGDRTIAAPALQHSEHTKAQAPVDRKVITSAPTTAVPGEMSTLPSDVPAPVPQPPGSANIGGFFPNTVPDSQERIDERPTPEDEPDSGEAPIPEGPEENAMNRNFRPTIVKNSSQEGALPQAQIDTDNPNYPTLEQPLAGRLSVRESLAETASDNQNAWSVFEAVGETPNGENTRLWQDHKASERRRFAGSLFVPRTADPELDKGKRERPELLSAQTPQYIQSVFRDAAKELLAEHMAVMKRPHTESVEAIPGDNVIRHDAKGLKRKTEPGVYEPVIANTTVDYSHYMPMWPESSQTLKPEFRSVHDAWRDVSTGLGLGKPNNLKRPRY